MQKIGLFFGSFNPIHNGHLILANHFAEYTDMDEVWMVVTPQNPFKQREKLYPIIIVWNWFIAPHKNTQN